jgi:RNA polymerase sigma-70 factor (ECF subfamily)
VKISHDNFDKSPRLDKIVEDGDSLNWVEKIIEQCNSKKIVVQMRDVNMRFAEITQILQMNETAIQ